MTEPIMSNLASDEALIVLRFLRRRFYGYEGYSDETMSRACRVAIAARLDFDYGLETLLEREFQEQGQDG